tara:strand:- start:2928 stop:3620 length:693 start_codon:yes stop_codon:yes gene_type:complete
MKINIYADGGNKDSIKKYNKGKLIKGFTTNPSILKKAKVKSYKKFAIDLLRIVKKKPISFEITTDTNKEIYDQAKEISSWGKNVYVKIPIVNSKGNSNINVIKKLYEEKIKLNVTAVFTMPQIKQLLSSLKKQNVQMILSIFAGRIADTGKDPLPFIKFAIKKRKNNKIKILWASAREIFNLYEADKVKCDIITLTDDLIKKIKLKHKSLKMYSIETSKTFFDDAKEMKF